MITRALEVWLWGTRIGAVGWPDGAPAASFEYDPSFLRSGVQVAPLMMPLRPGPFSFSSLSRETFHGLPGLLADALPDRFGNAVIDAWLAQTGRERQHFGPLDRLAYVGERAMGALTFKPAVNRPGDQAEVLAVDQLADLASRILQDRASLHVPLAPPASEEGLRQLLMVGTSAGGARAKALICWSEADRQARSGQLDAPEGFDHWLLKFDGAADGPNLTDSVGFGRIEYAYHLLARRAGIEMMPCRLLEEGGRAHFMTRRFDRPTRTERLHAQSLGALAHLDFNLPGASSYEQAFSVIRKLSLPASAREEMFRRMVFNVVARNQDDHVKNIAFLMDRRGTWSLAPAFDLTWSYNPSGAWTRQHQMSLNGRRDGFTRADLEAVARVASLKRGAAAHALEQVLSAVRAWPDVAASCGVPEPTIASIAASHRLRW